MLTDCRSLGGVEGAASTGRFRARYCLPFLTSHQNQDGGWGYFPDHRSSAEATSWALVALCAATEATPNAQVKARGFEWLRRTQLADGSWPSFAGQRRGCWATALACLALHAQGQSADRVASGLSWLLRAWPAEGRLGRRVLQKIFSDSHVRQNSALRGWNWTPDTASWVEPTAYALILLRNTIPEKPAALVVKRRQLAEAMLFDRMCQGGGWNSGNPLVYGVAGEPRVGPTVWALLALLDRRERPEIKLSLDWLERAYSQIQGPGSLALSYLCLGTYGRAPMPLEPALEDAYPKNQFFGSVLVTAWASIALSGRPTWLTPCDFKTKAACR
jgi:hypothetical protein